jgi:hypothetical protein
MFSASAILQVHPPEVPTLPINGSRKYLDELKKCIIEER